MPNWKANETREAKEQIRQILSKLELDQVMEIANWLNKYVEDTPSEQITFNQENQKKLRKLDFQSNFLNGIANFLKGEIDEPTKETTVVRWPTEGFDSDCNEINTCEVDEFLYDELDIEQFFEKEKLSRYYCPTCKSRDTLPLIFISHSLTQLQIRFMFDQLMPPDCRNVLDIGSGIGAVVYGASIFTEGKVATIGVEMDEKSVGLSLRAIEKFGLKNIEIIREDIRRLPQVFKPNQLIVMNNVFSFFLSKTEQEECWEFLHTNMLPGTVLLHHPKVHDVVEHLDLSFHVDDWLELVDTSKERLECANDRSEVYQELDAIVKYIVKEPAKL